MMLKDLYVLLQEDLNFLFTNRIPRIALTRWMGKFSKNKNPLIRDLSIGTWKLFSGLDLSEAKKSTFESMHDCFIRELKPGLRSFDPDPQTICSPCDGIVGACGNIRSDQIFQAKGMPYSLTELMGSPELATKYSSGTYVTLRLTSSMYHRFHAPADCTVHRVTHIKGDTWNVNPIALKRVARLFCRNERAIIEMTLDGPQRPLCLVPVGAILVASIRLHCLDLQLHHDYQGPQTMSCQACSLKGEEMGWFEHGSTIIVLAPQGMRLADGIENGHHIKLGQPLMKWVL
jgi:phosphatidylserine decarboxylase